MDLTLDALDKELEKQLDQIEQVECDLFFKRLRLAGLMSTKDALLRQIIASNEEVQPSDKRG